MMLADSVFRCRDSLKSAFAKPFDRNPLIVAAKRLNWR